ncbi:MAG: flagellar filament capping protein FliD [Cycloclasticus sp.]
MSISSPGVGSGIDVSALVTKLVNAEGAAKNGRLNLREGQFQSDISAYGSLKSSLTGFQSAVKGLQDITEFQVRSASSSDTGVFTATADKTANESQYSVEVVQLAQAHKLITVGGFSNTEAVGAGTLTLTQNASSFSITVSATDTLADVQTAINSATDNTGLTASIINVDDGLGGTEQKLIFTANTTGLDNAITITAADDDGDNANAAGLSRLVNAQLDTPAAALDGQIKVDGQLISSANDTFSSVITGITITAVSVGAGETLGITEDKANIRSKIDEFITSYNELVKTFKGLGSYDTASKTGGLLVGDSVLRGIESAIRKEISSPVSGLSGEFNTLAALGITTDETGKLSLDSTKLDKALDSNYDEIGSFFAGSNGLSKALDQVIEGYIGSGGIIESRTSGLQNRIEGITEQREALERRLQSVETRLLKQFSVMDQLVSSLKNQSSFLTQQLAILPGPYKPK